MADCIIEEKVFRIKKAAFEGIEVAAAIDRGCSLTKILYAAAGSSDDTYDLHAVLFPNSSFEAGVEYLASRSIVRRSDAGKLHITGAGCDKYRRLIEEKLGVSVHFVDEFATMLNGVRWLLQSLPLEEVCHHDEEVDTTVFSKMQQNPDGEGLNKQWQVQAADSDDVFPVLFGLCGSGAGFIKVPASCECQLLAGVGLGGKPLLGYGRMLLGTADYDEIMRLAEVGNRSSIDTQARDLLRADSDSPYGSLPGSLPIFAFGKVVDKELTREQCSTEDLAHALVQLSRLTSSTA